MALTNIETNIILDLYDHDLTPTKIKAIALDSNTRYVSAVIRDRGGIYDVGQNTSITLTVMRPDKVGVQIVGETVAHTETTPDEQTITTYGAYAELSQVALAIKGTLRAQFKLVSGEQILRTEIFTINNGEALDATIEEWAGDLDGHNLDEMAQSIENLSSDVTEIQEDVSDLKEDFTKMNTATAEDVGKALKAKTVTDGKVTEWEFGEAGGDSEELERLTEEIDGEQVAITFESVDGILFRENGTKFEAQASYIVFYFPITNGAKYQLSYQKTDSNSVSYTYAITDAIPAVGVTGTYVGTTLIPSRGTGSYEFTAPSDGYFTMCRWRSGHTVINTGTGTSGGLDLRVAILEEQIEQAEQTGIDLANLKNKLDGKTVTIEKGIYWVGSPVIGTTTESNLNHETNNNQGKCTVLSLPANKLLRIVGVGLSNSTRLYFTCDVATGILIDMSDSSDQLKLQAHYLCYDRNVRVYINCSNAYDHFIQIVDDTSAYVDISKVYGVRQDSVIDLNGKAETRNAVKNIKKAKYGWRSPVTFLHFSDLHGDKTNLQRIMDFATDGNISPYIDDIIHSGDLVTVSLDDGLDFFDAVSGSENIILVAGNHDVATGTGSNVDYSGATPEDTYNALFKDRIGNWGVTQPTEGATNHLGYFYKDYATSKLRVIFLDPNHGTEYITGEITWFEDALQSAYNSGYAVMCVEHYAFPSASCSIVNCSFSPRDGFGGGFAGWELPPTFVNAIEAFIVYGGEFVAWLCGHGHQDHVLLHNNGHQFCIAVSTATYNRQRTLISDEYRDLGTKSQDLFNIVSVDTQAKTISILRVGADLTRLMNSKKHLCIDYANRTVVWND